MGHMRRQEDLNNLLNLRAIHLHHEMRAWMLDMTADSTNLMQETLSLQSNSIGQETTPRSNSKSFLWAELDISDDRLPITWHRVVDINISEGSKRQETRITTQLTILRSMCHPIRNIPLRLAPARTSEVLRSQLLLTILEQARFAHTSLTSLLLTSLPPFQQPRTDISRLSSTKIPLQLQWDMILHTKILFKSRPRFLRRLCGHMNNSAQGHRKRH